MYTLQKKNGDTNATKSHTLSMQRDLGVRRAVSLRFAQYGGEGGGEKKELVKKERVGAEKQTCYPTHFFNNPLVPVTLPNG